LANSLRVEGLCAGYGAVQVLNGISLSVSDGETVTLLGTNGNGKSTLMKCIMGMVPLNAGRITAVIEGVDHDLAGMAPEEIVDLGIVLVPEGRRLFPRLTVGDLAECYQHGPFRHHAATSPFASKPSPSGRAPSTTAA
jgi:branched-chain amino acid transport system ATP-binding protein